MDSPDSHQIELGAEDIAMVGSVATSHINFRGVLHFPMERLGEPVLRAPIKVPATWRYQGR